MRVIDCVVSGAAAATACLPVHSLRRLLMGMNVLMPVRVLTQSLRARPRPLLLAAAVYCESVIRTLTGVYRAVAAA